MRKIIILMLSVLCIIITSLLIRAYFGSDSVLSYMIGVPIGWVIGYIAAKLFTNKN